MTRHSATKVAGLPECPSYVAHPQAVWFDEHWRPIIEMLDQRRIALQFDRDYLMMKNTLLEDDLTYLMREKDKLIAELKRQQCFGPGKAECEDCGAVVVKS